MNIGLVLSGAMAKGAFEVGALKALGNYIPREEIKYMSCASIGTANGYGYFTGKLDQVENMWKSICNGKPRATIPEMVKGELLQKYIDDILSPEDKIDIPFYCALLDARHRSVSYKNIENAEMGVIDSCLRASVAFPLYNEAVKLDGGQFYDGGLGDNIPIYPLLEHDIDCLICVYFDEVSYKFENSEFDKKIVKIFFPTMGRWRQSFVIHNSEVDSMIQDGYDRTNYILSKIFEKGHDDAERVQDAIARFNNELPPAHMRMTTDVVITNINKVTQAFTKRKKT